MRSFPVLVLRLNFIVQKEPCPADQRGNHQYDQQELGHGNQGIRLPAVGSRPIWGGRTEKPAQAAISRDFRCPVPPTFRILYFMKPILAGCRAHACRGHVSRPDITCPRQAWAWHRMFPMNRFMQRIVPTLAALLTLSAAARIAPADVFVLTGGGQVVGELVNRDESPRQRYVVQTADGAKVTLDAAQVQQILHPRPDEAEYERIRPTYPDTAAAQWALAQWCREHKLPKQREVHLQRVIELDPNHVEARHALGYSQLDGQWVTRDEVMTQRGWVKYKGKWMLPQEKELIEKKHQQEAAQQEWFRKLKLWRGWLGGDRDQQARENFHAIDDPVAVKALAIALRDDSALPARLLYVDALAKIDTREAARALAIASIYDSVEEVRLTCLDRLQTKKRPDVVAYFVGKLKDKKSSNEVINLAGVALGRMRDPSAISPLIDALVTIHKFKIAKPGGDNSTSSTFGTGPGGRGAPGGGGIGMSAGGGPTIISKPFANQCVLDALVALTGQNFNFDQQAWRYWYAAQKKPPEAFDPRRN